MKEVKVECELNNNDYLKINEDVGGFFITIKEQKVINKVYLSHENALKIMRFIERTMSP